MTARYLLTVLGDAPVALTVANSSSTSRVVILEAGRSPSAAMTCPSVVAFAAFTRDARLGQHAFTISQRRWLGAGYVGQPPHVGLGDFAEGHAARAALVLDALHVRRLGHVCGHQQRSSHDGGTLVVGAIGHPSTATGPRARGGIAFEPCRADAALNLLAIVPELRLVKRLAAMLAYDDVGVWEWGGHDGSDLPVAVIIQAMGTTWVPHPWWVPIWVPN